MDLTLSAMDQIRAMVEEGESSAAAVDPSGVRTDSGPAAPVYRSGGRLKASAAIRAGNQAPWRTSRNTNRNRSRHRRPAQNRFGASGSRPGSDLMRCGADPLLLLRELGRMGRLTAKVSTDAIPPLADLEAQRCYVSWDMTLATMATVDAIRDVFIFVEDICELAIEAGKPEAGTRVSERVVEAAEGAKAQETKTESASGEKPPAICESDRIAQALEEKRRNPGRRTNDQESAASLRVPAARLDQLVDLVGELVTVQARLNEVAARSSPSSEGGGSQKRSSG